MKKLPSVNSILSTFRKAIARLERCEADHDKHATACTSQARELDVLCAASVAEAERARQVCAKLQDLIGE